MGFLGFGNYNKPGPGVSKDEPPKAAPVRYFEIYGRKMSKLIQANLLFFVPFAIAFILMFFLFFLVSPHPALLLPSANPEIPVQLNWWALYVVPIPLILISPFIGGITLITRNFAREEHAFIWTDFMKATKNNFKYFLLNGVVCYVAYVVLTFSTFYYYNMLYKGWFYYIPLGFTIVALLLFVFAQYYLPILFVTFDLKFKQAYKNAFIFAALGMGRNFLLTFLFAALAAVVLLLPVNPYLMMFVLFIFFLLFFFSFVSFTVNFTVYPLIKKMMIDKANQDTTEISATQEKDNSLLDETEAEEDDENEFVYVNGRLVKKSDIKNK